MGGPPCHTWRTVPVSRRGVSCGGWCDRAGSVGGEPGDRDPHGVPQWRNALAHRARRPRGTAGLDHAPARRGARVAPGAGAHRREWLTRRGAPPDAGGGMGPTPAPDASGYRVVLPLRMLGGGWAPHPPPLRERTLDVIADLVTVTGSVVRAGVLEGAQIAVAEGGPGRPPADGFTIDPAPPHTSALGRVLLAFSPAEVVDDVLAAVRAANASPGPERLRRLLSTTRLARLSVCRTEDGTRCTVAVPVFGIGGGLLTALEATATDPRSGYEAVRGALLVAAGSLSRELATAHSPATGSDGAGDEEMAGGAETGPGSATG